MQIPGGARAQGVVMDEIDTHIIVDNELQGP